MSHPPGTDDQSPFIRTLHGGAGIPGSEVVSDRSGTIYRLGRRLGGSGDVFELDDGRFAEPVVIKLFPRAAGLDAQSVDAFARAATAASSLGHPQIARTLDAGALENGTPFLVTERLTGETLKDLFARRVTLATADGLAVLQAVGAALSAAHAAGLVHGEVRPDNIFIASGRRRGAGGGAGQPGAIKLLDFGVCYLTAPLRPTDGGDDMNNGQSFLSPEQRTGQAAPDDLDGRSDEYALAVLARQLLAPNQARRSPALTAVLAMAAAQQPNDRFDTVELFLSALQEVLGGAMMPGGTRRETLKPLPAAHIVLDDDERPTSPPTHRRPTSSRNSGAYGALTQQFFEDGNRLSEEAAAAELHKSDRSLSAMRIPRHNSAKVVVAMGAFAAIALVATAWAGMWNPLLTVRNSARVVFAGRPHTVASAAPGVTVPLATGESATAQTPSPSLGMPATAHDTPSAVAPAAANAPAPAPAAPAVVASPSPVGTAPPAAVATAEPPSSTSAPAAAPAPAAPAASAPTHGRSAESEPLAENGLPKAAAAPARPSTAARHPAARREPLRGYVWSPSEHRLVPANRAVGTISLPPPASTAPAQWPVPSGAASSLPTITPPPVLSTEPPPQRAAPITTAPIIDDPATAPAPSPGPGVNGTR